MPKNLPKSGLPDYLSIFMIFGYTTGTDSTIDISNLFYEETEKSNINIFEFLYKDFKLENNIFGYYPLEAIKFTYIPEEIKMFIHNLDYIEDGYDETEEEKLQIKEPYIFCSDNEKSKLCNKAHVFEYELIIEQNKELIFLFILTIKLIINKIQNIN